MKKHADSLKGSAGFTLLEVLVALIIIGISLGAVFQAFSQSKQIAWKADEKTEGARIAQNILADSALIHAALQEKNKEGDVPGERGWTYKLSVRPLALESEDGEMPIEIPSMLNLSLLLVYDTGQRQKSFYLDRWYRR